jgi:glycerophosphoryl diester phosphodiesterase
MTELRMRWAHQGGAEEAPSNTIAAMRQAWGEGKGPANALECDVHCTSDDHLVVIHDRTLDRTTSGLGKVRHHTLEALRQLDAGYWWIKWKVDDHHASPQAYEPPNGARGRGPTDPAYRIPTLVEVLDEFDAVPFTIEIKAWRAARPLVDELHARGRTDITVTSFFDPILWLARWRMRRYRPWSIPLSPATGFMTWFTVRSSLRIPPTKTRYARIQIPRRLAKVRFIADAHRADMKVDVWTINDEPTMRDLIAKEVDGIMTDRPTTLQGVVDDLK